MHDAFLMSQEAERLYSPFGQARKAVGMSVFA